MICSREKGDKKGGKIKGRKLSSKAGREKSDGK